MLDGIIGEFQLNIGRFASMLILTIPMLIKKKPNLIVTKKNRIPILLLCLVLFGMNYTNYASTIYIPSGTSNTAYMVSFMSSALLISTMTTWWTEKQFHPTTFMCNCVTILLLSLGIILLVQPPLLFGEKPHISYKSFCNPSRFEEYLKSTLPTDIMGNTTTVLHREEKQSQNTHITTLFSFLGYFYAIVAGILTTCYVLLGKHIFTTELPMVGCTWIALINSVLSIICTALFESFVLPKSLFCNFVFLFHAIFTGFMTVSGFIAMENVPSTDLSVIGSLSVAVIFCFQFSVLKNASPSYSPVNALSIGAAIAVSLISLLKPLRECIRLRTKNET